MFNILVFLVMCVLLLGLIYVASTFLASLLANYDLFFTKVEEGRCKAITKNRAFHRAVVSLQGKNFRAVVDPQFFNRIRERLAILEREPETPDTARQKETLKKECEWSHWEIVPDPEWGERRKKRRWLLLAENVYWVGIPTVHQVHSFRFEWTSLEHKKDEKTKRPFSLNEREDHKTEILIQDDVYAFELEKLETSEPIQVNIIYLITVSIINPRKALFAVNKWLETIGNQLGSRFRDYLGSTKFLFLIRDWKESTRDGAGGLGAILQREFRDYLEEAQAEYGVDIKKVQVIDINPVDPEVTKAMQAEFKEEQSAKGRKAEAEGKGQAIERVAKAETTRATSLYQAAAAVKNGGPQMFVAEQIRDSKLLAIGGGINPLINLPAPGSEPTESS